uniref:Uncharacterized protein n=1 Tax=Lotharella oceanica TaxID=641309 RepID=A0A7S2TWR4_9EUKA
MGNKESRGGGRVGGGETASKGPGKSPAPSRQGTADEERRKRAEAMEKKLAKQKGRHKSKAAKSKENWEKYKQLDAAAKKKAQSQATVTNGVLSQPATRSKPRAKQDIGPQSAIFNTRA